MPLVLKELCCCGFSRAWLLALHEQTLTVAHVHSARARVAFVTGQRAPVTAGTYEADVIRRRDPIRATDTARISPLVTETIRSRSYVVAPILVDARVVALISADRPEGPLPVTTQDQEIISAYARIAGQSVHRTLLGQQLASLHNDVRELTAIVNTRADRRREQILGLSRPAAADSAEDVAPRQAPLVNPGRIRELLTPRELEVLRLMAAGETNATIAEQLVISGGTVKSHVKSILRKLHASNRTTAVSRYYKLTGA